MGKLFAILGLFLSTQSFAAFNLSAVLFETSSGQILKALNSVGPGDTISGVGPFVIKAKGSGTSTITCSFDAGASEAATVTTGGYICPVPQSASSNGPHSVSISSLNGPLSNSYYTMTGQPLIPTISCSTATCVQNALNGALAGSAGNPTVLDFGGSIISNCGLVSLDAVKPYVTIKNLNLVGTNSDCQIGNTTAKATTTNVVLDTISVTNGTHSTTLASCTGTTGVASVVLYGMSNTLQNSTITGGTASGVFLGGSNNVVTNNTFNNVNTYNGKTMTACSGVLVPGYHELISFNTFNTCNGTCIHLSPDTQYTAPNISPSLSANNCVWGNLINNAINQSFVGTQYSGDAGAIYAGWNNGHNTNVQWNSILGLNPNNYGNKNCGGFTCASALYADNNTSFYTFKNNYVNVAAGYPALKLNPQTYLDNPGGVLQSGNRTAQNNSWTGNTPISSAMRVLNGKGQTVMMQSPDASCPNTCNNKVNASSNPPFNAGVGSASTLPAPQFLVSQ